MTNPVLFQRVEGGAIFLAATFVYFNQNLSLLYYVLFLFAFDAFMIGYLTNKRVGAILYNIGHSLTVPAILSIFVITTSNRFLLGLVCLWFAHIGIDRALGYGLKFSSGFKHTHLGDIGKK